MVDEAPPVKKKRTQKATSQPEPSEIPIKTLTPAIDPLKGLNLTRPKPPQDDEDIPREPPPVSDAVGKVVDLVFNASRDKMREVTIITREQGRLLPQLDVVNIFEHYIIEIAQYRQDAAMYAQIYKRKRPLAPDILDEFSYRTAQWQKSVNGVNLKEGVNIALAETESKNDSDPWSTPADHSE